MARPDSYIGSSEAVDRLVVVKQCPITSGRPTRMAEKSFRKLCKHHQSNLVSWNYGSTRGEAKLTWCGICRGKKRPAELEIIPLVELKNEQQQERDMAKKRQPQKCGCCGQVKSIVSQCSGDLVCSSCASLYGAINKRPEMVLTAINKLQPELLKALAGSGRVPVHVESRALKAIAEIVGYEGEDGDQLLMRVRAIASNEQNCEECERISGNSLPIDLIKALDCTTDDWEMAAIQTAALLEQAIGQRIIDAGQINQLRNDLGALAQGADRMREQFDKIKADHSYVNDVNDKLSAQLAAVYSDLDRIKEEYTMTVDRLHELEQQHAAHLQVFAQLADLVEGSPEYPAELPARFAALLSKTATDATIGHCSGEQSMQPSSLDSHLLDLLIDFPGIPLERIATIREAV